MDAARRRCRVDLEPVEQAQRRTTLLARDVDLAGEEPGQVETPVGGGRVELGQEGAVGAVIGRSERHQHPLVPAYVGEGDERLRLQVEHALELARVAGVGPIDDHQAWRAPGRGVARARCGRQAGRRVGRAAGRVGRAGGRALPREGGERLRRGARVHRGGGAADLPGELARRQVGVDAAACRRRRRSWSATGGTRTRGSQRRVRAPATVPSAAGVATVQAPRTPVLAMLVVVVVTV